MMIHVRFRGKADTLRGPLIVISCMLLMQLSAGAANEETSIYCTYCLCSGRVVTVGTSTAASKTHRRAHGAP